MKAIQVFDNGGASIDRYTVLFAPVQYQLYKAYPYLAMSALPFHPQGFCQHGETNVNWGTKHFGKKIPFAALPPDCQKAVLQELEEEN